MTSHSSLSFTFSHETCSGRSFCITRSPSSRTFSTAALSRYFLYSRVAATDCLTPVSRSRRGHKGTAHEVITSTLNDSPKRYDYSKSYYARESRPLWSTQDFKNFDGCHHWQYTSSWIWFLGSARRSRVNGYAGIASSYASNKAWTVT